MPPAHHHRKSVGVNKKFKGGSKGSGSKHSGRVEAPVAPQNNVKQLKLNNRADRVNHSKQLQKNRHAEQTVKRRLGSKSGSPKIVAFISLSENVDLSVLAGHIGNQCNFNEIIKNPLPYCSTVTTQVENKASRFTFIAVPRDPIAVADIAKIADVLYFAISPNTANVSKEQWEKLHMMAASSSSASSSFNDLNNTDSNDPNNNTPFIDRIFNIDQLGNHFLQIVKAQGLPTSIGVIHGLDKITDAKKNKFLSTLATNYFHQVFDDKVNCFPLDNDTTHVGPLLRATANKLSREIPWRQSRSRMLIESIQYKTNHDYDVANAAQDTDDSKLYDLQSGTMKISGFLRGDYSINANQLVHLTGFGDFQVIRIETHVNEHKDKKTGQMPEKIVSLSMADSRESLEGLISLDGDDSNTSTDGVYNSNSVAFESSGNMNMVEFNAMMKQKQLVSSNNDEATLRANDMDATTSTHTTTSEENTSSIHNNYSNLDKTHTFLSWRAQNIATIQSVSTAKSGDYAAQQQQPLFTSEIIADQKHQDENGIIQSVWDSIDLNVKSDGSAETLSKYGRPLGVGDIFDGTHLVGDDDDDDDNVDDDNFDNDIDDEDDESMAPSQILRVKKQLKRDAQVNDGFSTTSSLFSSLSGFSMGSLRDPNLSPEELKEKFSELPYKEKVRRLLKYGLPGEDKLHKIRRRMEREEVSNPDEVDYHPSVTARARFVRYHPMKSFRHSVWDVREDLPAEYNHIVQFANFDVSVRNARDACCIVDESPLGGLDFSNLNNSTNDDDNSNDELSSMNDADDEIITEYLSSNLLPDGSRLVEGINPERMYPITAYISNVPVHVYTTLLNCEAYGLAWWLFRHERKVTVSHMLIRRHKEYEAPIRSKDPMYVQIGFRRVVAPPIYSEIDPHTQDRSLYKRFLPNDDKFYLASMYSRITLPPATVLFFPAQVFGSYKNEFSFNPLVASGRLVECNPNKIILKRAVLTGYPASVNKYSVVVRHMFHNSNDVNWFKPVQVWTKHGRTGHIVTSRGLHGIFKAIFDDTIKHKAPVHMTLYKRQFPVWNPAYI